MLFLLSQAAFAFSAGACSARRCCSVCISVSSDAAKCAMLVDDLGDGLGADSFVPDTFRSYLTCPAGIFGFFDWCRLATVSKADATFSHARMSELKNDRTGGS